MGSVSDIAASAGHAGTASEPPDAADELRPPAFQLAPRMAKALLIGVFGGFYAIAFVRIVLASKGTEAVVLSAIYMSALAWLQLAVFARVPPRPVGRTEYLALIAQFFLVYAPLFEFRQAWAGQPGFLAGSVLLVLPAVVAWPLFALIVASMGVTQTIFTGVPIDVAYIAVATMTTGLMVFGLTRLAGLISELNRARSELARMAVAQERLRFARDLHDLLGYSLSAITLKSELTHRLVNSAPDKAQEELSEVLDISRRALSDVRAVASGYRELSLEAEAASARSVLIAADVDVHMDLVYGELPVQLRTVLATILREGVTNVLRHSKAEWCEVTVRQNGDDVTMDIVNDGVAETPAEPAPNSGSGIQNLSARVAALNGRLTAGLDAVGRYRLHVTAPVSLGRAMSRH